MQDYMVHSPVLRSYVGFCQEFVCNKSLLYKKWKHAKLDNFRRTSFNNDRKNSRGKDGKTMSRQVTTQRPVSRDCRCKFCFYVGVDTRGFFVVPGYGSNVHTNHVKLNSQEIKFPTSLLPQDTKDVLADLINTNANLGVVVNFVEKSTQSIQKREYLLTRLKEAYESETKEALIVKDQHLLDKDNAING